MIEFFRNIWISFISADLLRQDWFWGIMAIVISLIVFALGQRSGNSISRANFVYNISNDFATNERILKVYQWMEMCRRRNYNAKNYRQLSLTDGKDTVDLDFVDIDSYINHFEAVYIILDKVRLRNIDELFQQRFFTFMMNPYIQQEELFECFSSDVNDFRLYKKWLTSIYQRKGRNVEALQHYMQTYTCGDYELKRPLIWERSLLMRFKQRQSIKKYLLNYVHYICDPQCRYGYYAVTNRSGQRKVLRIITPSASDLSDLLALQTTVVNHLPDKDWYYPSTEQELSAAIADPQKYWAVQVVDGRNIVAFAYVIAQPDIAHDLYRDLPQMQSGSKTCIFETVFVHPAYRGFSIQTLLVDTLCDWAYLHGKRSVCATIHPDNCYSQANFEANGFARITDIPQGKYGSHRHYYAKKLQKKPSGGTYTIYPYL